MSLDYIVATVVIFFIGIWAGQTKGGTYVILEQRERIIRNCSNGGLLRVIDIEPTLERIEVREYGDVDVDDALASITRIANTMKLVAIRESERSMSPQRIAEMLTELKIDLTDDIYEISHALLSIVSYYEKLNKHN